MPTLRQLEAQFYRITDPKTWTPVQTLAEAQGVQFLCPKCFVENKGNVGTHMVMCWFEDRGVPDEMEPKPGRWKPQGKGLDDLTFVPGQRSNSVGLNGGCNWHGFVTNGSAE